jgi:uncharacterized membrane protein
MRNKNLYFSLVIIFLINVLFKLIHISSQPFWYDEIISVKDTLLDFGHIKHESEWDTNPPFYYYLLWMWTKVFGISEVGVRSMSVFFNALTAVFVFILANKITTKLNAWILVFIFSLHPFLYYYAQEARCYSLLIFLVITNLLILHSLVNNPGRARAFFLGISNFLIIYTHYIAGLMILFQFIYLALIFRKKIFLLLLAYLIPLFLVLLRFTTKQFLLIFSFNSKKESWIKLVGPEDLWNASLNLYISVFVLIAYLILLFIFLVKASKHSRKESKDLLYFKLYIIFLPVIFIPLFYFLGRSIPVFIDRYLIFLIPYIILSFMIVSDSRALFYVFAAVILISEIANIKINQPRSTDYRLCSVVAREIEKNKNVYILLQTNGVVNLFTYYYDLNLFKMGKVSREYLADRNILYINNFSDLKNIIFDENRPILFFQSYQKADDDLQIRKYFKRKGYYQYTTTEIEGVKLNYLEKL